MRRYLSMLIREKGKSLDDEINIDGHYGLTWEVLVDYIDTEAKPYHKTIRNTLVAIDFKNGDVFHYLTHLARGMLKAAGYEVN